MGGVAGVFLLDGWCVGRKGVELVAPSIIGVKKEDFSNLISPR